jgi:hypothetical protein
MKKELVMRVQTDLLSVALLGFGVVACGQKIFLGRALERVIRDDKWAQTVDDWSKLLRQDVAGILLLLSITNALLAAIAAILIFR